MKIIHNDFKLSSYNYELPSELIAQRPSEVRDESRLLVYNRKKDQVTHASFRDISRYLPQNSCLVFNESKVFPCRLKCERSTGGKVEVFILKINDEDNIHHALVKANHKKKIGDQFFCHNEFFEIIARDTKGHFHLKFSNTSLDKFLKENAKLPIPPYIRGGESDEKDNVDYQTIFAKNSGSVAAPTAGLHFTERVFKSLSEKGVDKAFVNLHVGLGTFKPVVSDDIRDHDIHSEYFYVDSENYSKIKAHEKVFAVGTTSLRVLESLHKGYDNDGETNIFLYPGVQVESISGLMTNFHLPKSSLLMLVSSLIGREKTLEIYAEAVREKYRFFSYGDAMLIL